MLIRISFIILLFVLLAQICVVGQSTKRSRTKTGIVTRAASRTGTGAVRVSHRRSLPAGPPRSGRKKARRSRKLTTPNPNVSLQTSLTTHFQTATPVPLRVAPPHRTATTLRVLPQTSFSRRPIPALTPPPLRGFKVNAAQNDAPPAIRPPPGMAKKLNMANINDFMRLARFMLRRRRTQRKIRRPKHF